MRIHEILIESQQLDEGPMLDKAGTLVGKAVGGAAKGVGAVAGGIAGIGRAFKKGYAGGKAVVGGDPSPNADEPTPVADPKATPTPGPAPTPAPVADPKATPTPGPAPTPVDPKATPEPGPAPTPAPVDPKATPTPEPAPVDPKAPTAKDINAAGPDGTAPAKDQTGAAGAALAKTTAAVDQQTTDKAGQTVYAQVKANIDKLDKKGKQRILQLLTKSIAALPVKAAPVKAPAAKPAAGAADPAAPAAVAPAGGAPAGGAPAPAADTTAAPATPAAPAADATATPPAVTPPAGTTPAAEVPVKKKRAPKKPAAPSQAEIDADRERNMGVTSDSIIRKHVSLAETLMQAIAKEKSRMVAEGKISIFRK